MLRRFLSNKSLFILLFVFIIIGAAILPGSTIRAEYSDERCIPPGVLVMEYDTENNFVELAIKETIDLNRDEVNFVKLVVSDNQSQVRTGNEFELTAEANQQDADIVFIKMTLVDPKGREVHQVKAEESPEGWNIADLEKHFGQTVSQKMTPLLEIIREHQKKIREAENSAFNARVKCKEKEFMSGVSFQFILRVWRGPEQIRKKEKSG